MWSLGPLRPSCYRATTTLQCSVLSAGLRTRSSQLPRASKAVPLSQSEGTSSSGKASKQDLHLQPDENSKAWTKKPFPKTELQYRWESLPPTQDQLEYADKFFLRSQPKFLWSSPKFATMSFGDTPEVCILGRSNAGKSSLLNALFGKDIAHSSSKPGRTKMMNAFGIGSDASNHKHRLVVLDMPGYGKGDNANWGLQIMKYLNQRKQLTRAFVLAHSEHGLLESDKQLLALFRTQGIPHQVLFSKVDKLLFPSAKRLPSETNLHTRLGDLKNRMQHAKEVIQPDQEDERGALGEIIACSAKFKINGYTVGVDLVRHAMLHAAGLEFHPPLKKLVKGPEVVSWVDLGIVEEVPR